MECFVKRAVDRLCQCRRAFSNLNASTLGFAAKADEEIPPAETSRSHEGNRNGTHRQRAGGFDRPPAARRDRRRVVAQHLLRFPVSQLPALLLRPAGFSHRHLDDEHGARLARLPADRFQGIVRRRRRRRHCADACLRRLGRLGGRSFPETLRPSLHPNRDDDSRLCFRRSGLVRAHPAMGDHCPWSVWRRRDGFRYAGPAILRRRDREPRGPDECDLAQQRDVQRRAHHRPRHSGFPDGESRDRSLLLYRRRELSRRARRAPHDAPPAAGAERGDAAARLPNRSKVFATFGITPGSGRFLRSSRSSGFSAGRTRC